MKVKLLVTIFLLLVASVSGVFAQVVVLDSVGSAGRIGSDTIKAGQAVKFYIRFNNNTAEFIAGLSNGFRVYSTDGASWGSTLVDSARFVNQMIEMNGFGGPFTSVLSGDGLLSDTATTSGIASGAGLPPGANRTPVIITVQPNAASHGKHLCIDSAYFPPGGDWLWSGDSEMSPTWAGPYCYTIKDTNASTTKNIVLSRSTIELTFLEGTNPGNETFNITSDGAPIALTLSDDQTWMSVSPASGNTPQLATVSFTAAALAPGNYNGTITVAGTGAANTPRTVAVILHVTPLPSNLVVTTGPLSFTATQGGANPANQPISINTDNDPLSFTITDDQTWLSVSPASGTTPANPAVSVNIAGLTPGPYSGTITVTSAGAANSPRTITVNLTVAAAPISNLVVSESLLNFVAQANGANPPSQGFNITSDNLQLNVSVSDNAPWLTATTMPATTPSVTTAAVNITGLAAGEYDGVITITSAGANNSPRTVNVHLSVTAEPVFVLVVEPIELNFTAEEDGPNPTSQNINVTEATAEVVSFAITENASWLSFNPASGSTPQQVTAFIDITGLAPGNYSEIVSVNIVTMALASSRATLTVNLTVTAKPVLTLAVTPTVLNFTGFAGGSNPSSQSISVTELGGGNVGFNLSESTSWFSLANVSSTTPGSADVALDITGLAAGSYQGTISVTSAETDNDPLLVTVNLELSTPTSDADSVWVDNVPAIPGGKVAVPINFLNSCSLKDINIALEWTSSDITFDSISLVGSRHETWYEFFALDSAIGNHHQLIIFGTTMFDNGPTIDPGYGLLATLHFTVSETTLPSIIPITFMAEGPWANGFTANPIFGMICEQYTLVQAASVDGSVIIGEKPAFVCGYVVDTTGNPIEGATVQLWGEFPFGSPEMTTSSDVTGYFEFSDFTSNPVDIYGFKNGYYPDLKANTSSYDDGVMLVLAPVGEIVASYEWVNFYCGNNTFKGAPLPLGAVIDAYDPDGIHCGTFTVNEAGKYGFLPVYRDDPFEAGDQGAEPGDAIRFYVNGIEAVTNGPTTWTQNGDAFEVCLEAADNVARSCQLAQGWNLVSWNVDTDSDAIESALASVSECLELVLGFEQGGLTYDPSLIEFSTLHNVDHLSGYWIKTSCAITLDIAGNAVPVSTPITVTKGWNLVSYLPDATLATETALASLSGTLLVGLGFDGNGLVYQPGQGQFNTLTELSSCFGYWVKVSQNGTLTYHDGPLPGSSIMVKAEEAADLTLGAGGVYATTRWMNLYSRNLTLDGKPVASGSVVEAFSKDGLKVGSFVMTKSNKFGFMPVYADDPTTSVVEGVIPGESFTLAINGNATSEEFVWGNVGDNAEVLNLSAKTTGGSLPTSFSLNQNYPNPFNPTTTISFALPTAGKARVEVFDLLGRQVATIFDGYATAGETRVTWDSRNSGGMPVSSGVYFYRLTADKFTETKKMTLLK
jgi:Secretion system C-terminal sorting domain/Viral BACON domain